MTQTIVPLSKRYTAHDKTFDKITLREPTYKEIYMDGLGRPQEWQPTSGGGAVMVTYSSVVDEYLQKLVIEPGYECIGALSAADAMKLERAVCVFFLDMPASTKPSTRSSSASAGRSRKSRA
ncbi:phage tail assembly protein [Agrobacterium rhizogenes]|uniref:phage tail assembly protein n=1 Tax=Rhizobium rhizogenes TaxID=359 RepID=UPI0015736459|nr:phage tail assembly protein [Rhizobium rhizogenes]NTF87495.1 phage tail assembly protein [Rhizobium rhizogenes]